MLSGRALAGPRGREAREMPPGPNDTERMVQLCDLEAMEQVHEWRPDLRPDRVVPYAISVLAVDGGVVRADGAAFRSGRNWYNLRFKCQLAPGHGAVVGFEFLVGEPVPADQWEARNLPAEH